MLCIEQNDEWLVGRRYLSVESISEVLRFETDPPTKTDKEANESSRPEPPTASPTSGAPNSYTTSRDLTPDPPA